MARDEQGGKMTRQAAGGLIGRDRDLGFLREFVRQAAAGGGALVLSGDPGMGKTALLNALAESAAAAGTVVLRVTGAEFEGEISFAGLNQVLLPVLGDVDELDAVHRDALRVALGFGTGPPPDRLLVSNAVLVLLQRVAARERTGDLRVLAAAGSGDYRLEDLAPAERDHLVRVGQNPGRVSFRHPLIRSAAVEASTAAERRRAHQAVAAVLAGQPERRAWHLGEAAVAPDEHVAALLEEAAHRSHQRGDYLGAVAGLTRAAGLSPAAAERGRRLAEAAYIGAEALGEVRGTSRLLDGIRQAGPQDSGPLHSAAAAAFVMLNGDGHIDTVHRMLSDAIASGAHGYDAGDTALLSALWALAMACFLGGRRELWDTFHDAVARLTPGPPPDLALTIDMFADPARTGVAALPRLEAALRTVHHEVDPHVIDNVAAAAMYADRLAEVRDRKSVV